MKLLNSIILSCCLFSASTLAAQELVINNSALHIVFADGTEANVSSCSDFIPLHQAGAKIKELPDLSDPDFQQAHVEFSKCLMHSWAIQNGYTQKAKSAITLDAVVKHFPATADLSPSSDNKTMLQAIPDLKPEDDRFVSHTAGEGYVIEDAWAFKNSSGKETDFVMLAGYATGGTMAVARLWKIDSKATTPWKVTKIQS
ncbi:hypothetical protein [Kosakonia sp. S42]|uniref:hypothetical protein n=1 Tax=Kosakonia sp. S42 TaxID=2767458 RepID=UPI00190A240A|nr:hypothetical protein [Kosakonia sp. S42]MBK0018991.1 hypothetical protein [Kosakonia sp. S42]